MGLACIHRQCSNKRWNTFLWLVIVLTIALSATQTQAGDGSIAAVIQKAGNADSDEVRLDYLRQLRERPNLDSSLREDLTKLITQIERWHSEQRLD